MFVTFLLINCIFPLIKLKKKKKNLLENGDFNSQLSIDLYVCVKSITLCPIKHPYYHFGLDPCHYGLLV